MNAASEHAEASLL